ncbi:hypothetical protein R3X25_12360 [Lutibacter sp. TH_r2]|uniref:hypothetical protein n=1 Tax=Lutibacter sp. TH_r2 TaxID=3082083 RepID=UPI00295308D7|nr:hypothetical protein [Lutibacter sp. TH_r2]MDV7188078.1 hypothetical protein [Lutibacter sp. TH_r2]
MNSIIKILLLISFFFISIVSKAQDKETILFGKVKNDTLLLENILVVNIRTNLGTSSLKNGEYYIKAKLGDSIYFKSLTHKNRKVKITENHIEKRYIEVFLEPQVNELETVNISSSIKVDLDNVYRDKNMVLDNDARYYASPPSVLNQVDPNAGQAGVDMLGLLVRGIDALYFKKKREEKRDFAVIERKKTLFVDNIVYNYGEKFFKRDLKIHKDKIYQYIDYCDAKGLGEYYDKSEIEIKNFLVIQSNEFKALQQ